MAKLMSNRELALFRLLVNYAERLEKCNPRGVGMGPLRETLAKEIAEQLYFDIDEDDIIEISEEVTGS